MKYDFRTLSSADFEDLARDLVSADLGVRLEGFGPGPDGGIDGRHAEGDKNLILQAKHKPGSTFSSLKSVMKKERKSINRLKPTRYILATSQSLTPLRKTQLAGIIGGALKKVSDILGCTDLNSMLLRHPSIEEAHIKLWLSSTAVFKRLLRSSAFAYTAASRGEMLDKLMIFVTNPSFPQARQILEKHHVLIVSGPPGVGKTTLAQMLAYAYVGEKWEFTAVRNLDDEFSEIHDTKKQIFFFDDFLGKISLDRKSLATRDTILAQFIRRIQKSKNARFILTTRAYIYEEARSVSESIGDPRLDISKYVLDVGVYTRRIRARILYNHIAASSLSMDYVHALISGEVLPTIVDHPNYNPRIIEWMTAPSLLMNVLPDAYANHFMEMLDHPKEIWDRAFREHIPPKAQHLLISLYFSSEDGEDLEELRTSFHAVHAQLCMIHNVPSAPTDFQDSIKLLEGSFLIIHNHEVSFVNPSVRDYLEEYLSDVHLLTQLAPIAQSARWSQEIWQHYKTIQTSASVRPSLFVNLFIGIADHFKDFQSWRKMSHGWKRIDLPWTARIRLLAEWQAISSDALIFAPSLRGLVFNPSEEPTSWIDGKGLPDLIAAFRNGKWVNLPGSKEIACKLESNFIQILQSALPSDELDGIREAIEEMEPKDFSEEAAAALVAAIEYEIAHTSSNLDEIDAEAELEDHAGRLQELGRWADLDPSSAVRSVEDRLKQLRDRHVEKKKVSFPSGTAPEQDNFDNEALRHLFEGLLQRS